jgi:ferrochelatase
VKSLQIICPGFSADCLETLEEIGEENREYFMSAGGERYEYIPCLNSTPAHINALGQMIAQQLDGWLQTPTPDCAATQQRARALGAAR